MCSDAYSELYDITDMLVFDAGRYGFEKLQCFNAEKGFYYTHTEEEVRRITDETLERLRL